ncbi:MAG: dienelactone hydrolase family protein [Alphaproteobacteria bacterium]|nr:dienelactone hydrolase family protein [Alphaproteobacteria bacterium]
MIRHSIFTAFVLVLASPLALAESGPKDMAARTELHAIQTLTLTDKQFLTGDANGRPTVIAGQLRVAQGNGRLPVVVLMHGSGGMGANTELWARTFNAMGISTFTLDGFTARGLVQVSTDQAKLGRMNFILDIYRALDVVAKHPRVDPQRIVLMGFSRGGQAALYASLKRFHQMWNKSGVEFAAYIPFYPDCATTFIGDTDTADKPIRIFAGTPDDYNPVALCKAYAGRLNAAGHDVQVTEYPNAPHSFDNPLGPLTATASPQSQSVRNCKIKEEQGVLINASTGAPFVYTDACVALGPHMGHDPDATQQVQQAVTGFVRGVFKLP